MRLKQNTVKGMVSVVIPNYNYGIYLGEAIESVLNQSYDNYEIIVVDDNSDDNSRVIVNQYIEKYPDKRIKLIHNLDGPSGTPNVINQGLSRMEGEYFCWLSSDDVFLEDKLEKQVDVLKKFSSLGLVFTNYDILAEDKSIAPRSHSLDFSSLDKYAFFVSMLKQNIVNGNTVMIRKIAFEKVGGFDTKWEKYPHSWIGTEYLKWLEIFLCFDVKYISESLHLSRKHEGNSVYGRAGVWEKISSLMLQEFFSRYSISDLWKELDVSSDENACIAIETNIFLVLKNNKKIHTAFKRLQELDKVDSFVSEKVKYNLENVDYFDFIASIARAVVLEDRNTSYNEFLSYNYDIDWLPYIDVSSIYAVGSALNKCCDFNRAFELFNYLDKKATIDSELRSGIYFHLGEIFFKKQNLLKAKDYFENCVALNPFHKKAVVYIGKIKEEL